MEAITTIAIRYLSRRDYSRRELTDRLQAKGFASELVEVALNDLEEKRYQSDERFAETFLRSRISRGDGPFKIKMQLNQKGIAETLIEQLFNDSGINWLEQAHRVRRKHFGDQLPVDSKSLSKQMRYLRNKGFYQQHIDAVVNSTDDGA